MAECSLPREMNGSSDSGLIPCDFRVASLLYQSKTLEGLEWAIQEIMSSITQDLLVKSVHAISGRLESLLAKYGAFIEF